MQACVMLLLHIKYRTGVKSAVDYSFTQMIECFRGLNWVGWTKGLVLPATPWVYSRLKNMNDYINWRVFTGNT